MNNKNNFQLLDLFSFYFIFAWAIFIPFSSFFIFSIIKELYFIEPSEIVFPFIGSIYFYFFLIIFTFFIYINFNIFFKKNR